MDRDLDPIVGKWYRHLDKGQLFRVVAYDEERGTVELQHFDGDVEEIDASAWFDMKIEPAEAPQDWTGPVDDVEEEDWEDERPEGQGDDDDDDAEEDLYSGDADR